MARKNQANLQERVDKALKKKQRDKGGGAGKYGRNRIKCLRYKSENRRQKNKDRRAAKRVRNFS